MFKPELIRRVVRFGLVGIAVMLFFTGLNWWLAPHVGADAAFLIAYPPALTLHFCLNKWWTFGEKAPAARRQVGEYLLMALVTFLTQGAVFKALLYFTSFPSWFDAAVANVAQMAITFVVMQRRIFAPATK